MKEGLVVSAKYQISGKGQRSCVWESEANKNFDISCYWFNINLINNLKYLR